MNVIVKFGERTNLLLLTTAPLYLVLSIETLADLFETLVAAYGAAFAFFKKRELQGIKEPKKKVAKKEESKALDLSGVELEGESTEEVPIHESCDEMRKKIRAYLKLPNITQAGFLREAVKAFHDGRKIQSKQLNDFLGKKGALAGNTSGT